MKYFSMHFQNSQEILVILAKRTIHIFYFKPIFSPSKVSSSALGSTSVEEHSSYHVISSSISVATSSTRRRHYSSSSSCEVQLISGLESSSTEKEISRLSSDSESETPSRPATFSSEILLRIKPQLIKYQ